MTFTGGKNDFTIVPAIPADKLRMQEIEKACWLSTYPNETLGITREELSDFLDNAGRRNFMAISFSMRSPASHFLVVKTDGRIMGYAIGKKETHDAKTPRGFLHHLYVDPEFWGHGAGSALLQKILDWIGEGTEAATTVVEYNTNAIRLYGKFGFKESGRPSPERMARLSSGITIPEIEMTRPGRSRS